MTERLKFFRLRKTPYRERKKFRHSVIYALHHRDFMQTSRRPPRSAIFGPKACGFHGNGHLSPRDRNVDVFDEHRESTNGNISVPLLLIPQVFFLPSGSWVRSQVWIFPFLSSGSTDFVFCPPFCFGATSPGFGGFLSALARHA